ncbi:MULTISPECIES: hypothetical protein [Chromobacterium]|uniref:hypothetical protein n=1 Tax=Chromobacterium TaxID=535 RepID=UPI001D08242D|nr:MULTISPECIES: hypothetical protein [Chromobacterium]MCP1292975.1 hypothetical protein [Chromobacterium sp. S0633]UJB32759.1 hypothetical protein HQN78_17895 [Chromobacterium sp. Beijing]
MFYNHARPPATTSHSAGDSVPDIFCWTKMGAEAGQTLDAIIRRKELERLAGNGVFAWGIGNSLGTSVDLARQMSPSGRVDVLFTPMKSPPKQIDASPSQTFLWLYYIESDGRIASLPGHLLITSRGGEHKKAHYALLCHSESSIEDDVLEHYIYAASARNLASSNRIGSSQVTSVVRYGLDAVAPDDAPYKVAFRAALHQQGFLKLVSPVCLEGAIAKLYHQACAATSAMEWLSLASEVRKMAEELVIPVPGTDLFA